MAVPVTTRSAQRCVVGAGAAGEIGDHAAQFGRRALVMAGQRAFAAVGPALLPSLAGRDVAAHVAQGEQVRKTRASVDFLVAAGREHHAELVIACGGGEVMDGGKAVSHALGVPLINVPTTAATNACGTAGASIEGDSVPRRTWYQGADVIIADTRVIAAAGGRYLASGMGDVVPSWYGAQLALRRNVPGVSATRFGMARLCTEIVLADGARAFRACEAGVPALEVDRVVEAIVYCSGVGGFGMSGDHSLHPARMSGCQKQAIHGEWVAFGFLVRVVLGAEFADELPLLVPFLQSVGLPTRFLDFGLEDPSQEELLAEARRILGANGGDYDTGREVTPEALVEAMREVDFLGRQHATLRQ